MLLVKDNETHTYLHNEISYSFAFDFTQNLHNEILHNYETFTIIFLGINPPSFAFNCIENVSYRWR